MQPSDLRNRLLSDLQELLHPISPGTAKAITFMSSGELLACSAEPDWLVEGVLVRGEAAVIGGPKKALKTSIAVDLGVTVATGSLFLNKYRAPHQLNVAFFCGESSDVTMKRTLQRVLDSKGIKDLNGLHLDWSFKLPKVCDEESLQELQEALKSKAVNVVIIDPLYLAMSSSAAADQAGNLFKTGPFLKKLADACLDAGATPILIHHFTKASNRVKRRASELDDLSQSGVAEFARQWILIGRRSPFDTNHGRHELHLNMGGSAGHATEAFVTINEGKMESDFSGRTWDVTHVLPGDHTQGASPMLTLDENAQFKVIEHLRENPQGDTKTGIGEAIKIKGKTLTTAIQTLLDDAKIIAGTVSKPGGRSGDRGYSGYKLVAPPKGIRKAVLCDYPSD
jgi:hypothetical protein